MNLTLSVNPTDADEVKAAIGILESLGGTSKPAATKKTAAKTTAAKEEPSDEMTAKTNAVISAKSLNRVAIITEKKQNAVMKKDKRSIKSFEIIVWIILFLLCSCF